MNARVPQIQPGRKLSLLGLQPLADPLLGVARKMAHVLAVDQRLMYELTVTSKRRRLSTLALAVFVAVAIGGCGAHASVSVQGGPQQVPQLNHQVEQVISDKMFQGRGWRPKSVSCPQSMEAKKGKTYRCTLTASDGSTLGATVTMQGGTNFHFTTDQQAQPSR